MSWQPIETAPKDGTFIDLWNKKAGARIVNVRWVVEPRDRFAHPTCIMDGWKTSREGPWGCLSPDQFSHWMPLPSPPQSQAEAEKQ
jgi:hypothetical protein